MFATTLNPQLAFAAYAATSAITTAAFAKTPKPAQTETALKTERPPRVSGYGRYKTFGAYLLYTTAGDGSAIDVWAFHEGRIDGIEGWYLGDDKVTINAGGYVQPGQDKRYGENGDNIRVKANLGASPGVPWADVIAKLPGVWTNKHRGDGVVTGYMISKAVKEKNFASVYATGGPNQAPLGLVIRAQPVFDWRDPAQSLADPLSWKWSENAILHLAHYQLVRNGKTWARHFAPTLAWWTTAANVCDEPVALKGGGTEPRYRSCVSHKHAGDGAEHKAVVAALLACCDGWMAPRADGALVVFAGRYQAPTVGIGLDQIVSYTVDDEIEDEDAVNEIPVTYVSALHDYNTVDTDPWTDEDDILARGAVRSDPLDNQVPSHAQGRRLAKRKMTQDMAPKRGTCVTTSAGGDIVGQRFIDLDLSEGVGTEHAFTPYSGPVEVTQLKQNLETGAVSFAWRAVDPNIDAWNPVTEEGSPAPVGNRVALEPVATPTTVSATAEIDEGGSSARIRVVATGTDRADATWSARWRRTGDSAWNEQEYTDLDPGPSVKMLTTLVPVNVVIEVEVAYSLGDGRPSDWSPPRTADTTTANLGPAAPTALTVSPAGGGDGAVSWRNPTSANFSYVRVYRGTSATFSAATQIGGNMVGGLGAVQSITDAAGAGTRHYWVRAYSGANVAGGMVGPVSAVIT